MPGSVTVLWHFLFRFGHIRFGPIPNRITIQPSITTRVESRHILRLAQIPSHAQPSTSATEFAHPQKSSYLCTRKNIRRQMPRHKAPLVRSSPLQNVQARKLTSESINNGGS